MWNNYQEVGIAYGKWEEEMLIDEDLPEVSEMEKEFNRQEEEFRKKYKNRDYYVD